MKSREKFEITFEVASYESDLTGKMSLFALFNRFQDLAGKHAEYLGVGYDLLRESNLAWILSRIKVRILRLPLWGETVHLTTWPKGIDRLFAMRDFSLKNEKGETLALATSAWLLVDIEKGRPKRIENLSVDLLFPEAPHAIPETPDKIQTSENLTTVFQKPVWLSEIDTNRHVNNAQYAKWICDCFTEDKIREKSITGIQINFLEETFLGDTIELQMYSGNNGEEEYFICGKSMSKESIVFNSIIAWL